MVSFFACKRACRASSISASERWPLWAFYFAKDREGSSDLALVATPPAVPSGVHLSTAREDFVFGCVLGPLFWGGWVARLGAILIKNKVRDGSLGCLCL